MSSDTPQPDNPDHALVLNFIAGSGEPVPLDTSPLLQALNGVLLVHDPDTLSLTFEFAPGPLFRQGAGFVQGGAIAAMLDFAMAFAGMAVIPPDKSVTTTAMTSSFHAGARAERYIVIGRIDKPGRRFLFASATIEAEGRVIAQATSGLLVI
ncbi:PaaI family thioesterase [Maritimibacter harenae]|nr:PaaI family thioesterase [Maritimibacter harenae]